MAKLEAFFRLSPTVVSCHYSPSNTFLASFIQYLISNERKKQGKISRDSDENSKKDLDDRRREWEVMRVVREEANPRTVKKAGPNGSTVANEFYLST